MAYGAIGCRFDSCRVYLTFPSFPRGIEFFPFPVIVQICAACSQARSPKDRVIHAGQVCFRLNPKRLQIPQQPFTDCTSSAMILPVSTTREVRPCKPTASRKLARAQQRTRSVFSVITGLELEARAVPPLKSSGGEPLRIRYATTRWSRHRPSSS